MRRSQNLRHPLSVSQQYRGPTQCAMQTASNIFDIRIKQTTWIGHKADYKTFIPFGINARTIYFPSINYTTKQRYINTMSSLRIFRAVCCHWFKIVRWFQFCHTVARLYSSMYSRRKLSRWSWLKDHLWSWLKAD